MDMWVGTTQGKRGARHMQQKYIWSGVVEEHVTRGCYVPHIILIIEKTVLSKE